MPNDPFYATLAWRLLRAEVVRKRGGECSVCGKAISGRKCHVDHVISRQERPDLALMETNLQVLCLSCHNRKGTRRDGVLGHARKHLDHGGCDADGEPIAADHPWNAEE